MITIGIDNQEVTFSEAIVKQFKILELIIKHKIFTQIKTDKGDFIPIEDITKEQIINILTKRVKRYLADPNDLDSSSIGYNLALVSKLDNKIASIAIRFGTPLISGKDHISIDISDDDYYASHFNELTGKFYSLLQELILMVNPIYALCTDHKLKPLLGDDDYNYGFIVYQRGNILKELAVAKNVEVIPFAEGYIWKSDFSNHQNGIATVLECWR